MHPSSVVRKLSRPGVKTRSFFSSFFIAHYRHSFDIISVGENPRYFRSFGAALEQFCLTGNFGMKIRSFLKLATMLVIGAFVLPAGAGAQQDLPWQRGNVPQDSYRPDDGRSYQEPGEAYDPARHGKARSQQYSAQQSQNNSGYDSGYDALRNNNGRSQQEYNDARPYNNGQGERQAPREYRAPRQYNDRPQARQPDYPRRNYPQQGYPRQGYQPPASQGPGQPYAPPSVSRKQYDNYNNRRQARPPAYNDTYSDDEILNAGHRFFGKITKGLAKVIAHVFKKSGRPNGYILGEEGGGALIAGLRYGEGTIYTKAGDRQKIYWQGPSIGYDFGAEGAKTMILIYHLRDINDIYARYAGVDGSAYLVGGVGVTFQKRGRVVLAPIRSGLGVRLGANVGYLKYTRRPTWNPF